MTATLYSKEVKIMKLTISDGFIKVFSHVFIGLFALFCLYPLLLTLGVSFSSENLVQIHGYKLIPEKVSLDAYTYLLVSNGDRILKSYMVTVFVTVAGTLLSLFITSMMAFAMASRDMKYRNAIAMFSYFTVIFSAGIIPWYIVCVNYYKLTDNLLGLILPYSVNVWFLFLMRNYYQSIPDAILESAKMDGANHFYTYLRIASPLSKTALLTVGLLYSLQFWNDWWLAIMFINKQDLFPLQYYLYTIISNAQALAGGNVSSLSGKISLPTETIKMAATVIATGPIVFLYPFVQKYFVQGIMVGGVKG